MPHVVLLGDSIFDNRSYTRGEPDVVGHLRAILPPPWSTTLLAVDGSTTRDIDRQILRVPDDTTHVVVAVGGNDALMNRDLLGTRVSSTAETLALFHERVTRFEASYRRAVAAVLSIGRHTTLCTIYNGNLGAEEGRLARLALALFNDVIIRVTVERGADLIELRLVCSEPEDYANPIEPSGKGGRKIAEAVARATGANGDERRGTRVIGP